MILVHDASSGRDVLVGRLEVIEGARRPAGFAFTYARDWLRDGFALGPGMPLSAQPQTFRSLPGPLSDAGPDQWGRSVLLASHQHVNHDGDVLLRTADLTRQGSLRLADEREPGRWLGDGHRTQSLLSLERVSRAVARLEADAATDSDLDVLLGAASSPGGARPKAALRAGDGSLRLAKFPRAEDRWDVLSWEATALTLASRSGLAVPRIEVRPNRADRSVLVMHRFDRQGAERRLGYISARTMLGHDEADVVAPSYVEIVQAQSRHLADPVAGAEQVVRRAALSILVNDVHDHPRNHGYLRTPRGWVVSPSFDVTIHPWREAATPVAPGRDPVDRSLTDLIEEAPSFGLSADRVREIVTQVHAAVETWPQVAVRIGILDPEEHQVMARATAFARDEARSITTTSHAVPAPPGARRRGESGREESRGGAGEVWVPPHVRNGRPIEGHWRRRRP